MKNRLELKVGVLLMIIAIVLGAFGAHSLTKVVDEPTVASFQTGVRYQIYHALGIILLVLLNEKNSFSKKIFSFMITGVVFFSGSIYLMTIGKVLDFNFAKYVWFITPLGGAFLLASWSLLFLNLVKREKV